MKWIFVLWLVVLTACSSTSGVVAVSGDTYMVSRSEKGLATTGSLVKADALKEANTFCESKGKAMEVIKVTQNDMVPFKSPSQAEVEFKCVSLN